MKTPAKSRYSVGADSYRAVVQTLREVQDDLDRPWSLESMAQRAGYDPFHFAHAFRAIVGEAPLLYVRSLRLERAAHDLVFSPEKDLVAIGLEAGYSSSEAFRRAFVKAFNVAPSVIRKNAPTTTALASLSSRTERPAVLRPAPSLRSDRFWWAISSNPQQCPNCASKPAGSLGGLPRSTLYTVEP